MFALWEANKEIWEIWLKSEWKFEQPLVCIDFNTASTSEQPATTIAAQTTAKQTFEVRLQCGYGCFFKN